MSDYRVRKQVLLAALADACAVPAGSRTKLETRLMLLNRVGFPAGVNAGRGYRGGYSIDQFWQTVLAFQLIELGAPLSRLVEMVNESWDIAYLAIARSLPGNQLVDMNFWWIIEPAGLSDFHLNTPRREHGDALDAARPIETVGLEPGGSLQVYAESRHLHKFLAVDAQHVVNAVLTVLARPEFEIDQNELRAHLLDWASPKQRLHAHQQGRG